MLRNLVNNPEAVISQAFNPRFLFCWALAGTPCGTNNLTSEKDWADDFGMYLMGDEL